MSRIHGYRVSNKIVGFDRNEDNDDYNASIRNANDCKKMKRSFYIINCITNIYFIVFTARVTTKVYQHPGWLVQVPPDFISTRRAT